MRSCRRRLVNCFVVCALFGSLVVSSLPVAADDFYFNDKIVYPNPRQFTSETITASLSDYEDGSGPLAGITVCTIYHFNTTDSTKCGTTNGDGFVSISTYISGASRGYTVAVDLTADFGFGPVTFDTLYFTPL